MGIKPRVIPTLMIRWKKKMPVAPVANRVPKVSLATAAMCSPRQMTTTNSERTVSEPRKPNSSAITEKTKSVWLAGKKCSELWVPLSRP